MMDRAEATGLGVAVAGHAAILAALALGLANVSLPPVLNAPIEVSFVDETGLESAAPVAAESPPAPKFAELEGPVEPPPLPTAIPEPEPLPRPKSIEPTPAPKAKATPRPEPKAQTPSRSRPITQPKADSRPTGRLSGLLNGISDRESDSRSTTPPAQTASDAQKSAIVAEVRRQLKPYWQPPTGADVDKLLTQLSIKVARDGTVTDIRFMKQDNINDSNRSQAALHKERAIRAVKLASPFKNLPIQLYDAWKLLEPINFDARLTR